MGKLTRALDKSLTQKNQKGITAVQQLTESDKTSKKALVNAPILKSPDAGGLPADNAWDERLQISTDPAFPVFESFRRLRVRLLYAERQPKTLLITSVMPSEGKGFVCANLGIALSQDMEHHALMLDCDFRRPSLSYSFGISNEIGLVDYLQDNVDLSFLFRKTGQPKLSLLPSGKPPKNPAELLGSSKMAALIDELSGRYQDRIVLIDSPPSIVASETNVLANHTDGLILVVRHGVSKKEQVKKFVDAVGPEKILGLVYNACPQDKFSEFLYKKMNPVYSRYKYY